MNDLVNSSARKVDIEVYTLNLLKDFIYEHSRLGIKFFAP